MALKNSHKKLTKKALREKTKNTTNEWQMREKVSFAGLFRKSKENATLLRVFVESLAKKRKNHIELFTSLQVFYCLRHELILAHFTFVCKNPGFSQNRGKKQIG